VAESTADEGQLLPGVKQVSIDEDLEMLYVLQRSYRKTGKTQNGVELEQSCWHMLFVGEGHSNCAHLQIHEVDGCNHSSWTMSK
jgi:hypothetical protein